MGYFSVRVVDDDGDPREGASVTVFYSGLLGGHETQYTDEDGWTTFQNYEDRGGEVFVEGENMGEHSLSDGRTYSFTI